MLDDVRFTNERVFRHARRNRHRREPVDEDEATRVHRFRIGVKQDGAVGDDLDAANLVNLESASASLFARCDVAHVTDGLDPGGNRNWSCAKNVRRLRVERLCVNPHHLGEVGARGRYITGRTDDDVATRDVDLAVEGDVHCLVLTGSLRLIGRVNPLHDSFGESRPHANRVAYRDRTTCDRAGIPPHDSGLRDELHRETQCSVAT